jgi:hypothetical protein
VLTTSFCQHPKAVHVYVEVEEVIHFPDYVLLITSYILNKHEEKCAEVVFLSKGTLNMYTDKYEKPTRFEFRDDLLLKKINNGIINVLNSDDEDVLDEVDTITNCQVCYDDVIAKPLNMKSVDTVTECTLNVPILSQLFLESFINRKSVRRSENLDQFILSKLKKLYGHYDSHLNLLNKNYIGLLQDINSQELAMNYHSINTVFSVTSASGATLSLNEAEQRMKEKANSDYCYYNTYLKKREVIYETVSGVKKEQINIRNCILVLMMDNLVRLKYHKDPDLRTRRKSFHANMHSSNYHQRHAKRCCCS